MNKNIKGAIVVALIGGIGYVLYKRMFDAVSIVAKAQDKNFPKGSPHRSGIKKMFQDNPDYVKNWAKAIKSKSNTFYFNNKKYDVIGGSSCKTENCGY
jgi:hypothetical protein